MKTARRFLRSVLAPTALVVVLGLRAPALDPAKQLAEYARNSWGPAEGLPQNSVQAIQQTNDGYLWFGTQEGLARFDGVQFTVFNKANTSAIKSDDIIALKSAHDGSLWIGSRGGGLVHYQNGQFRRYSVEDG